MNQEKIKEDLMDSLIFLKDAIDHYQKGEFNFHKLIAIQLYALLCGDNALFLRAFPKIELAKVVPSSLECLEKTIGIMPDILIIGRSTIGQNGLQQHQLFVFDDAIPLVEWKRQTIAVINKQKLSIENVIKYVRDKSGAHFDPEFKPCIEDARNVNLADRKWHEELVFSIGLYISNILEEAIKKD